MMPEFTVKQFAQKEQVDERTVRRWIVKGAVDVRRTPGGGVRIYEPPSMTKTDTKRHPVR